MLGHTFSFRCVGFFAVVLLATCFATKSFGQKTSFWEARDIELPKDDAASPVVVCVWDTGVDLKTLPPGSIWINQHETVNGEDSDGNGFVDDVHGIAFDLQEQPASQMLMKVPERMGKVDLQKLVNEYKGNTDSLLGVRSKEAAAVMKATFSATPSENKIAIDQLRWTGEFVHGTNMAGICARGNPFIRVLSVRQQLSHRPPKPEVETYQRRARAYELAVDYMKSNGVRIANLSWSRWRALLYNAIEEHAVGENEQERIELSKQLMSIEHDALHAAIKNAPEILFVTTAGNVGQDMSDGAIPQMFDLPNILRVGATTTRGRPVLNNKDAAPDVYAHGHKVETRSVGGVQLFTMGTSSACANVTNLAAKILAVDASLSADEVKNLIIKTSSSYKKDASVKLINPTDAILRAKAALRERNDPHETEGSK